MTTREEADRAELEEMAFEEWWASNAEAVPFSKLAARRGWMACAATYKPVESPPPKVNPHGK